MPDSPLKPYLNLGCGRRYHPDWLNMDIAPQAPAVVAHDLRRGIPCPDNSLGVVYHAHLLEHFRRPEALRFLKECWRVLSPGGVLRVATPDLQRICELYLQKLEGAATGNAAARADYEWLLLEMYDQAVRERSGGEMREYLRQNPLPNEAFVLERIGAEGREIIQEFRNENSPPPRSRLRQVWRRPRLIWFGLRDALLRLLCGPGAAESLQIGRFRLSGEAHHWMYDRYSLARLLTEAGFSGPVVRTATESAIPHWRSFGLDAQPDGTEIKPDSLYMEATKPG